MNRTGAITILEARLREENAHLPDDIVDEIVFINLAHSEIIEPKVAA